MNQNGQYIKRGILTSHNLLESTFQASSNLPSTFTEVRKEVVMNNNMGNQHQPTIIVNKAPNLTAEELNQTKYVNSLGINHGRTELHFNYSNNGGASSNFVPPPPSKFLVSSNHQQSSNYYQSSGPQISQLPVQSNHLQTIQTIQPIYQNKRTTYIPHHIINEIPVINSQTKNYYQSHQQHQSEEVAEENNDYIEGGDSTVLQEYEKLYQKYMQQCQKNQSYTRKISDLQQQLSKNYREERQQRPQTNQSLVRQIVHTKQVFIAKPTRVDTKQLISILIKKIKPMMDETFDRRKASCLNKLRTLLSDQESIIKTSVVRSSEELTLKYRNL